MTTIAVYVQRLEPPFQTETELAGVVVYQNALVLELDGGERLVFDRQELEAAIAQPASRTEAA